MAPDELPWTTAHDEALRKSLEALADGADTMPLADPSAVRETGDRIRRRRSLAWTTVAAVVVVVTAGLGFAVAGRAQDVPTDLATRSSSPTATESPSPDPSPSPTPSATNTPTPTSTPTATPTGSTPPRRTQPPESSVAPPPTVSAPPVTRSCPTVVFTPNSGDGAFQVRATDVTCDVAESLIRAVDAAAGSPPPASIDVDGWHCTSEAVPDPQPIRDWRCVRDTDRVSWQRG